jgi:hypothetical protein
MSNFPRIQKTVAGWPKLPEVITPTNTTFLGEQNEPVDEKFKRRLANLFSQSPGVWRRAYLARLTYDGLPTPTVVLCVREDENAEHELLRGFPHMFGTIRRSGDFYDTMIIDEAQEQALKQVCKPFYEQA